MDLAIYAAIARTHTPALDVAMSRLSRAADYSRLSLSCRRPARSRGREHRPPRGCPRARVARGHLDRGQRRRQAARAPATPRPAGGRGPARAPRADAELALVPLGPLRRRLRVRDRCGSRVAGGGRPAARARRAGRLLARPHRRALPRRRARRRLCSAPHWHSSRPTWFGTAGLRRWRGGIRTMGTENTWRTSLQPQPRAAHRPSGMKSRRPRASRDFIPAG